MKRWISVALFSMIVTCLSIPSQAGILELRAGVGMNAANPDAFEDRAKTVSGQSLSSDNFDNFNADAYINLPVLPLGIGARYEWLQGDDSMNGSEFEINANNLSLLVDWRIIDTGLYFGPIVSVGYPWSEVKFKGGSENIKDQIKSENLSYSGGLEAGVRLGRFILGAEAGYLSMKLKSVNEGNIRAKVDLSGFYGKVMAGITLF